MRGNLESLQEVDLGWHTAGWKRDQDWDGKGSCEKGDSSVAPALQSEL